MLLIKVVKNYFSLFWWVTFFFFSQQSHHFNYLLSLFHLNNFFFSYFLLFLYLIFLQRIIHIHEIMTLSCKRDGKWEKKMREKRKKSVLIMWERNVKQNLVNEYYSSELVSNFTHQNFLVKMMRLGVVFFVFSSNWLTKITKKLFWWGY
jgi:hypothetical protein